MKRTCIADLFGPRLATLSFIIVGPFLLSSATIGHRLFVDLKDGLDTYTHPGDAAFHFAVAILGNSFIGLVAVAACQGGIHVFRHALRLGRRRGLVVTVFGVAFGVALWRAFHFVSFFRENRSMWIPQIGAAALGGVSLLVISWLRRKPLPSKWLWTGLSLVSLALNESVLGRSPRDYSDVRFVGVVFALVFAGLAAAAFLERLDLGLAKKLTIAGGATYALLAAFLAFYVPSASARAAVLLTGGGERLLIRHALCLATDRDGDGAPSHFFGTDPDNSNAHINTATPHAGKNPLVKDIPPLTASTPWPVPRPKAVRNLVWILVDAARTDSFESLLARDTPVRESFADFAYYKEFRSCGSKTVNVLYEWLAARGCKGDELKRGGGVLNMLQDDGYEAVHAGYLGTRDAMFPRLLKKSELVSDKAALREATAWLESRGTAPARPAFLFIHLNGGHTPYSGRGETLRDRYEDQLAISFEHVARFVRGFPKDWVTVVMGDHGEAFGEHGERHHSNTLYDELLRTPFLLRAPSVHAGMNDVPLSPKFPVI